MKTDEPKVVGESFPGACDLAAPARRDVPLDAVVQLAAMICGTPMSTVTVIEGAKQRHRAKVGVDAWETPKEHAFCVYTLKSPGMFVVPDALLDERFRENPLVTGPPNIRFYAGVPIRTELGEAIATLCVLDRVPRMLSGDQSGALEMLSRQVAARFESYGRMQQMARLQAENDRMQRMLTGRG